jgi:hypothetical protein
MKTPNHSIGINKGEIMPKGKGTYGSKVGRPIKMKKPKKKK